MSIENSDFILSPEELKKYAEWVQKSAEEDPDISAVTISFTFTPIGTEVVAHREVIEPKKNHLVIRDVWD